MALVVALSPISVLPALLLVLYSSRPRATSVTFLSGWLDRVSGLSPAVTGGFGLVFAVANPKILVACAAAGLAIGTSALSPAGRGLSVCYFVVLAASTTALPVLAHLVAAKRFDGTLERLRQWISRRQNEISAVALVVIGLVFVATGIGNR